MYYEKKTARNMTDRREFEKVFRSHYDGMYRLAMRMLGNDAESKDVVSDVFAHLLHSGTDLRSETLQAFLLTSVRNRCINLLVHKQKEQQMQQAIVVEMNYQILCHCSFPVGFMIRIITHPKTSKPDIPSIDL